MSLAKWLLLPFLLLAHFSVPATSKLCSRLQSASDAIHLQGVSLALDQLYIVEGEQLYKVPITREHIDSDRGRIALYDDSGGYARRRFESLGSWKDWHLLKDPLGKSSLQLEPNWKLHRLLFSGAAKGLSFEMIFKEGKDTYWAFRSQDELAKKAWEPAVSITDMDQRLELLFTKPLANATKLQVLTYFSNASDTNSSKEAFILSVGETNWLYVSSTAQQPKHRPLVEKLSAIYGFILADKVVHLWHVHHRSVLLFDFPFHPKPQMAITLKVVPFSEYFACNSSQWNRTPKPPASSSIGDDGLELLHLFIIVGALLFITLTLLVLICVTVFFKRAAVVSNASRSDPPNWTKKLAKMTTISRVNTPRTNRAVSSLNGPSSIEPSNSDVSQSLSVSKGKPTVRQTNSPKIKGRSKKKRSTTRSSTVR